MYLSNRDIKWAIECGQLIVKPAPSPEQGYDETSIDLHLGPVSEAKIWNIPQIAKAERDSGRLPKDGAPELKLGSFKYDEYAPSRQIHVPDEDPGDEHQLVFKRGPEVFVRKFGFLLWQTKEIVGTPKIDPERPLHVQQHPQLICFVDAKSTKARTGLLVHFTAPTIHAGWDGTVTLEITNLGPFTFVLRENDAIAQLIVAAISSSPDLTMRKSRSATQGQRKASGEKG